jgi:hypothetical protein
MSKSPLILLLAGCVGISPVAFGQHVLVCRGTDRVPIGSSGGFQMQEGESYPIIGLSGNVGALIFQTPLGGANYQGNRFRVVSGGQYAAPDLEVSLRDVTSKVTEHWEENKAGYRSKYSTWTTDWTGYIVLGGVRPIGQCYAALQWYSDGQPVGASATVLGQLDPGRPVRVALSISIAEAVTQGTYSFHVFSGASELKTSEVKKPDW